MNSLVTFGERGAGEAYPGICQLGLNFFFPGLSTLQTVGPKTHLRYPVNYKPERCGKIDI